MGVKGGGVSVLECLAEARGELVEGWGQRDGDLEEG